MCSLGATLLVAMSRPMEPSLLSKLVAEAVGTFILVFTVSQNVMSLSGDWAGVSIGGSLMLGVWALGGVSGGHFNPAVSLALALSQLLGGPGMPVWLMLLYWVVQVLSGALAGFLAHEIFSKEIVLKAASGFSLWQACSAELLYTCMLCFVVLNVAKASKNAGNSYYGLAIGFVVMAGATGAGAISMGCFNPAVAIALDFTNIKSGIGLCFVYAASELGGAILAALLFALVRPEDFNLRIPAQVSKLSSEFIGTFFLVLTVGLNVLANANAAAWAIGASLSSMVYALGSASGGHFNPAVSTAIFLSGQDPDFKIRNYLLYMLIQMAAGITAAFTYTGMYAGTDKTAFRLIEQGGFTEAQAIGAEGMSTFLLCFVVLAVAVSRITKNAEFFGLAIGFCIVVGGVASGKVSGGSLNPAVSFGISTAYLKEGGHAGLKRACFYSLAELMGGAAAAVVFCMTHHMQLGTEPLEDMELCAAADSDGEY